MIFEVIWQVINRCMFLALLFLSLNQSATYGVATSRVSVGAAPALQASAVLSFNGETHLRQPGDYYRMEPGSSCPDSLE